MKLNDKYSIKIERNIKQATITRKDIDLLLYIIKNRDFDENNVLGEIVDQVKELFSDSSWHRKIVQYPPRVFHKGAYHIELTEDNNKNWSIAIDLLKR